MLQSHNPIGWLVHCNLGNETLVNKALVVCKYKECVMASYAKGQVLRELLGDELYKDYFDD